MSEPARGARGLWCGLSKHRSLDFLQIGRLLAVLTLTNQVLHHTLHVQLLLPALGWPHITGPGPTTRQPLAMANSRLTGTSVSKPHAPVQASQRSSTFANQQSGLPAAASASARIVRSTARSCRARGARGLWCGLLALKTGDFLANPHCWRTWGGARCTRSMRSMDDALDRVEGPNSDPQPKHTGRPSMLNYQELKTVPK